MSDLARFATPVWIDEPSEDLRGEIAGWAEGIATEDRVVDPGVEDHVQAVLARVEDAARYALFFQPPDYLAEGADAGTDSSAR